MDTGANNTQVSDVSNNTWQLLKQMPANGCGSNNTPTQHTNREIIIDVAAISLLLS
jgi:hypothetical protein